MTNIRNFIRAALTIAVSVECSHAMPAAAEGPRWNFEVTPCFSGDDYNHKPHYFRCVMYAPIRNKHEQSVQPRWLESVLWEKEIVSGCIFDVDENGQLINFRPYPVRSKPPVGAYSQELVYTFVKSLGPLKTPAGSCSAMQRKGLAIVFDKYHYYSLGQTSPFKANCPTVICN